MAGSFSPYGQSQVFMPHLTAFWLSSCRHHDSLQPVAPGRQPGLCGRRILAGVERARARGVLQTGPAKSPSLSSVHLAEPG